MKKILIVDDEPLIRTLLEETLEDFQDHDVELLTAGNGFEGWTVIQKERPQLVILDVMMPKMSGYEVCQKIKQTPEFAGIWVIMLTAKGQEIDRLRGDEAGADEYVTKPFDPDYIIERAGKVLGIDV
ncbi:MAG: response regulator [Anaerolineae bacterium]|nr:response regulator [Anaerolineae bacterium]